MSHSMILPVTMVFAVTLGVYSLLTSPAHAEANKADVCHAEGNGSFHLINISGRAVGAHLAHGDGLPGDPVPGDPSSVFGDACEILQASSCPCDFSSTGLAEVGIDGAGDDCALSVDEPEPAIGLADQDLSSQAFAVTLDMQTGVCGRYGADATPIEFHDNLGTEELDDCLQDLNAAADALELPECDGGGVS